MQHAITFVIATLCILTICYRLYGIFFVKKVLRADDNEVTPSHTFEDGKDYVPTKNGLTLVVTLRLSPRRDLWLVRFWRHSSAICRASSGC